MNSEAARQLKIPFKHKQPKHTIVIYDKSSKGVKRTTIEHEKAESQNAGDWVCVNVKGMKFDRAVEVCQHEVGHEIFAEICEKDMDQCLGVLNE